MTPIWSVGHKFIKWPHIPSSPISPHQRSHNDARYLEGKMPTIAKCDRCRWTTRHRAPSPALALDILVLDILGHATHGHQLHGAHRPSRCSQGINRLPATPLEFSNSCAMRRSPSSSSRSVIGWVNISAACSTRGTFCTSAR